MDVIQSPKPGAEQSVQNGAGAMTPVTADGDAVQFATGASTGSGSGGDKPSPPPPDSWNAVYAIFTLLGTGLLFPYNTLVTAADYWVVAYPSTNIIFFIPLVMNLSSPPIMTFMVRFGSRFSFTKRIVIFFSVEAVLIIALPLIVDAADASASLYLTFLSVFIFGVATSVLTSTVYAWAAMFPPKYTQAVMSGNGFAGVIASFARILTKVSFPDDDDGVRRGSFVFFILSAVTTLSCAIGYVIMLRLPFTVYYRTLHKANQPAAPYGPSGASANPPPKAMVEPTTANGDLREPLIPAASSATPTASAAAVDGSVSPSAVGIDVNKDPFATPSSLTSVVAPPPAPPKLRYRPLLRKVLPHVSNVIGVFVATFLVFPGLVTSIVSRREGLPTGWLVIILLTEFNCFDLLGRNCPNWFVLVGPTKLWPFCWGRLLWFPLFLLCVKPVVFNSDVYAYFFMAGFAWTNGYFASLAMMYGPAAVEPFERESAGYIMSLALNVGILLGSLISLILNTVGYRRSAAAPHRRRNTAHSFARRSTVMCHSSSALSVCSPLHVLPPSRDSAIPG